MAGRRLSSTAHLLPPGLFEAWRFDDLVISTLDLHP
jgi:hypothetical protein